MAKLDYSKTKKRNNTPKHVNQFKLRKKAGKIRSENEERFGKTYEDGTFFINREEIPKYYPKQTVVWNGFYFNRQTSLFEYWERGECIDKIHWKSGQPSLIAWKKKHS